MVSYMCKTATGRLYPSLGAVSFLNIIKAKIFFISNIFCACYQSGAVMAVLAAVCAKVPEAKLGIIFLPMVTFSAGNVSGVVAGCM